MSAAGFIYPPNGPSVFPGEYIASGHGVHGAAAGANGFIDLVVDGSIVLPRPMDIVVISQWFIQENGATGATTVDLRIQARLASGGFVLAPGYPFSWSVGAGVDPFLATAVWEFAGLATGTHLLDIQMGPGNSPSQIQNFGRGGWQAFAKG